VLVDGRRINSATEDIGTGTYTIMTQTAAERLGLPIGHVAFKPGDSALPEAPVQGGSLTASLVGSAVQAACDAVQKSLFGLARNVDGSPLADAFGRFMTHNLADYHVPVCADVHDIEVIFVEERDEVVNPLGAKGLGEIGVVGVAAAIANAVFHATGKRIRELPITLDKLL